MIPAVAGVLLACAWAIALCNAPSPARAASIGQLQQEIDSSRGTVSQLAGAVSADTTEVNHLGNSISALQRQIASIQADLDAKRQQLLALRGQLDAARSHLKRLEAFLVRANALLTNQLVSTYEGSTPDIVTVVLDSTGFQDLLERISFQTRIRKQNVLVITTVRGARRAVAAQATKLGHLELRQQILTDQVLAQRNHLYQAKVSLVRRQIAATRVRDAKAGKLAGARGHLSSLQGELSRLQAIQAAQAAAAARAAARASAAADTPSPGSAGSGGSAAPPPPAASSGGFVFPLPKSAVVGPGSWSLDDGVDMSAPGDTPEYAVCSGTIVLHGIGGFGPWAPVLNCDSSIDGYSYVYYGHAGPLYQLPVGTHVSAGQVISSVGPGIVGISTGPHVEMGFCDSSGNPIGPGSAPTMMSLLQSSY